MFRNRGLLFGAFAFLIVLMLVQSLNGISERAHYARLMFVGTVAVLMLATSVLLAALLLRHIATVSRDLAYARRKRLMECDGNAATLWNRRISRLTRHGLDRIPEHRSGLRRLVRLKEFRRVSEAMDAIPMNREERVTACLAALDDVDEMTAEELNLQLLALGPEDEYLLGLWHLEAEAVEESMERPFEGKKPEMKTVSQEPAFHAA